MPTPFGLQWSLLPLVSLANWAENALGTVIATLFGSSLLFAITLGSFLCPQAPKWATLQPH